MNRKRDIEDLGDLYLENINENIKVDGVNEPGQFENEKKVSNDPQKNTGPENAEGVAEIADPAKVSKDKDGLNLHQLSDPVSKKTVNDSINISKMSDKSNNKSDFDKLYEFAMEGEGDLEDVMGGGGLDDLGDDLGGDDELGGDDKVTVELSRECADELHEVLMAAMGGSEEGDELGGLDDMGDDLEDLEDGTLPEKVVSEPEPKVLGGHGDRQHPEAGNLPGLKVKSASEPVSSGTAETGKVDEDPEPKPLGGHGDRQHGDAGKLPGAKVKSARKKNNPGDHMHGN